MRFQKAYILVLILSDIFALNSMERQPKIPKAQHDNFLLEELDFERGPLFGLEPQLFDDQELDAAAHAQLSLIKSVKSDNRARILALLQEKVNINEVDAEGNSALHWAVVNQNIPLIEMLVAHEADCFLKNYDGKRPIDLAPRTDEYGVALLATPKNSELALLLRAYYYNAFKYYLDQMVTFKLYLLYKFAHAVEPPNLQDQENFNNEYLPLLQNLYFKKFNI